MIDYLRNNRELATSFLKARWQVGLLIGIAAVIGVVATALPLKLLVVTMALPLLASYFVLALLRFDHAVLLIIFFAPLIPPSVGVEISPRIPLITIQRLMLIILYAALALRIVAQGWVIKLSRAPRHVWLVLALYLAAGVASSLFSTVPLKSFYRLFAHLFDNIGLFVIIISAAASYKETSFTRKALIALWISVACLAVLGIVDTVTGFNPLSLLPGVRGQAFARVYRLGVLRGQGFLPNPTALAIVAALGAILTVLILTWQRESLKRMGLWLMLLVFIAAMLATITRTGWLAFLVGIILWLLLARRAHFGLILAVLVVLAFLVIAGLGTMLYVAVVAGFDITRVSELATLLQRIEWMNVVWERITTGNVRFLFGFGLGTVEVLTVQWWIYLGFLAALTTQYLITLAETGMVGLLSFILLLFAGVRQSWRLMRSPETWIHDTSVFLLIAFLQIAIGCITLPLFAWAQTTYLFWILLGILITVPLSEELPADQLKPAAVPPTGGA